MAEARSCRWVPSPQSNRRRSPPRRTSSEGAPRKAVGMEPDVPRKTRSRSTPQVWTAPRAARRLVMRTVVSHASHMGFTLEDFGEEYAATVLEWVGSADDALDWAEAPFLRVGPELLEEWHAQRGIVPCVGRLGGELCAYGQIWEDQVEREAEVSRVLVKPELRRQGVGRSFVALLGVEARRRGFGVVVARIARRNRAGYACFRAAGFSRVSPEDEAERNLDEAEDHTWMRFDGPRA